MPGRAKLLLLAALLARTALAAQSVAMVFFSLGQYHSPALTGATATLVLLPGLVVSPLAGAILNRTSRTGLIIADFTFSATALMILTVLIALRLASPAPFLTIAACTSVTTPLSSAGIRALLPALVEDQLWDRVNGYDSATSTVAVIAGPALGGSVLGLAGAPAAFGSIAALYLIGSITVLAARLPARVQAPATPSVSILADAGRGLRTVLTDSTLRGLALTLSTTNIAFGLLTVALPVFLAARRASGGATSLGILWTVMGAGGLVAALLASRLSTVHRERLVMSLSIAVYALGYVILTFAGSLWLAGTAMLALGAGAAVSDIAILSLRQRHVGPAGLGMVIAISMSLNSAGAPVGSFVAGFAIAALHVRGVLALAALVSIVASVMPWLGLRPPHPPHLEALDA
jgi:MFS family permease